MESIAICGTFNENGGKPSGFMKKLFDGTTIINGGSIKVLDQMFNLITKQGSIYDVIYWFANVDNKLKKYLPEIKKNNPKCILISSKNNSEGKYTHGDLILRMLNVKSNLLLEVINEGWSISATLHDPLGNVFINKSNRVNDIREVMFNRVEQLYNFKRTASFNLGEALNVPNEEIFFDIIKDYADKFHTLIHAANQDRLLGNASFRCKRGFPSFKDGNLIFVSRRNVDKRYIDKDNFVSVVLPKYESMYEKRIEYFGYHKPSVDTPIQVKLYEYYKNIKYMIHSHTYIKDAPFTRNVIPCGAVEEFDEVIDIFPEEDTEWAFINLKGHGSLVMVSSLEFDRLNDIPYISRPAPEFHIPIIKNEKNTKNNT